MPDSRVAIFEYFTTHLNGIAMIAALVMIVATILSSADSLINVLSISIGKKFGVIGNKNKEDIDNRMSFKELMKISLIAVGVSVIAVSMAWLVPDIVRMMINATASLLLLLPTTLTSIFASKRSSTGAILSLTLGFVPIICFGIIGPLFNYTAMAKTSFVPATILSVIGYLVGYYIDKRNGRLLIDIISVDEQ